MRLSFERGTREDTARLAHHHYLAGAPATFARERDGAPAVRIARDESGDVAGVLVVSMPTLNGRWRALAWPERFAGVDRAAQAREINRSVRCISRVIVEPRFRSCGVARLLVRRYLDDPLTARTEAVASMGSFCPFFERAGMTAYRLGPTARDARLADALRAVHTEPWEALDPDRALSLVAHNAWLAREARIWADGAGSTRRHRNAAPAHLLAFACSRLTARPIAYAHGA